eukprot:CAMPEP_0195158238 /NCGR_PEP_ID=MMETSP0448-20130528/185565_1 /TAXON_ID=66468 /ORGANISM="Heterocapsa triquestra, Strain CCMP 448" /LENGTH=86 /DNA_ID=CAMNT_0040197035 /DNA_START=493 /DNA_END=753 /DNA_ORIENTATION=-
MIDGSGGQGLAHSSRALAGAPPLGSVSRGGALGWAGPLPGVPRVQAKALPGLVPELSDSDRLAEEPRGCPGSFSLRREVKIANACR